MRWNSSEQGGEDRYTKRREAIERLKTFGVARGLSLNGMTIRQLREEARP